ncbi:hypothetical protein AB0A70_24360 [Streptomyces morookaense]
MSRRRHRGPRERAWADWSGHVEGLSLLGVLLALCGVVVWLAFHGRPHRF